MPPLLYSAKHISILKDEGFRGQSVLKFTDLLWPTIFFQRIVTVLTTGQHASF